jgi:hypothetical protein
MAAQTIPSSKNRGKVSLEAGDAFGKTLRTIDQVKEKMIKAGFTDVVEYRFKCPIGPWAKDGRLKLLGKYNRLQWEEGIEGWSMMLLTQIRMCVRSSPSSSSSSSFFLPWGMRCWGWMVRLTSRSQWPRAEVEIYLAPMRQGLRDGDIHAYQEKYLLACPIFTILEYIHWIEVSLVSSTVVVYGRRPE